MKAQTNTDRRPQSRAERGIAVALTLLALSWLVFGASVRGQQADSSSDSFKQSLEAEFRIIPLHDGVLLEPREEIPDVAAIEVTEGNVAVDGESLDAEEVLSRLGEQRGELVLRLSALSDEVRQQVLSEGNTTLAESAQEGSEDTGNVGGISVPTPPTPPTPPRSPRVHSDAKVVLGSSLHVKAGETVQDVMVMGGSLTVDGVVAGDAVVVGGPGTVNGEVMGDFAVVGGPAELGPKSHVHGDVAAVGSSLTRAPGAIVDGQVSETTLPISGKWWSGRARDWAHEAHPMNAATPFWRITRIFYTVSRYLVLALLAMLAMLIARRPMERTAARVVRDPWKSGLVGLLAEILFLPVVVLVVVLLAISIIGIPLLILVPFALLALAVGAFFGYCSAAWALGRWLRNRFDWPIHDSYLQLLLGFAALAVLTLVGRLIHIGPLTPVAVLFLVVGAVLNYLVWTAGFGAVLMSRFGTSGPDSFPAQWVPAAPVEAALVDEDLPLSAPAETSGESPAEGGEYESGTENEDDRY